MHQILQHFMECIIPTQHLSVIHNSQLTLNIVESYISNVLKTDICLENK